MGSSVFSSHFLGFFIEFEMLSMHKWCSVLIVGTAVIDVSAKYLTRALSRPRASVVTFMLLHLTVDLGWMMESYIFCAFRVICEHEDLYYKIVFLEESHTLQELQILVMLEKCTYVKCMFS